MRNAVRAVVVCVTLLAAGVVRAQAPIEYRVSFPDAVHHLMQVEVTFRDVPPRPLQIRMSRSSPGRYAAFDFAKNVFMEHFTDGRGNALAAARPNPEEWDLSGHDGTVRVSYRLYGNRIDGTFLGCDERRAQLRRPCARR